MLIIHFAPEFFPLSLVLFFLHTSDSWSTISTRVGIDQVTEGGISGLYG